MRRERVTIQNRKEAQAGKFGKNSAGIVFENTCTVWAAVDFVRGMRAMNEGAVDVYGVVMIRMNYTDKIKPRSRIVYNNDIYQILPESFHADKRDMKIQFNAQMVVDN